MLPTNKDVVAAFTITLDLQQIYLKLLAVSQSGRAFYNCKDNLKQ